MTREEGINKSILDELFDIAYDNNIQKVQSARPATTQATTKPATTQATTKSPIVQYNLAQSSYALLDELSNTSREIRLYRKKIEIALKMEEQGHASHRIRQYLEQTFDIGESTSLKINEIVRKLNGFSSGNFQKELNLLPSKIENYNSMYEEYKSKFFFGKKQLAGKLYGLAYDISSTMELHVWLYQQYGDHSNALNWKKSADEWSDIGRQWANFF